MSNKKLNIIFLDFDDIKNPLLAGGQAHATLEVGSRLASKGHSVKVLCAKYPGYKDRKENGIEYKHISIDTGNIRLNNILYILTLPFSVRKIKNTDIIVECFTAPISTLYSPVFTKIPVVALTTSFEAEQFAKLYHLPILKYIEQYGLKKYKYFLPYTQHYVDKIRKENEKALIKLVPEGVSEDYLKIKKAKSEYLLFLGRFDIGQKGIDLLLNSYAQIKNKINYPLVIVGAGPDKNKIIDLIKELNLTDSVSVQGPAFGKKKEKYLSKAIAVAFPSRHEGFSLFSLEALASGLPLIAFDIPGLSWTGINTALKSKKYDLSDYAKNLLQINNSKKMKTMSKNARNFARKYTWENVANEFETFFYQILKLEENIK